MSSDLPGSTLLDLCRKQKITLVTAESCTGGLICASLTDIPGSSDIVWGGFVTYANAAKIRALSVSESLIAKKGAVSREVAEAMVTGALAMSDAGLAVAVSGIAGPGGGSPDKPVGTVWIAVSLKNGKMYSELFQFSGSRSQIRWSTVENALRICKKIILNDSSLDSEQS
ncbi:CinA family protein [Oceanispirochaeta sp.]|jgi:nicotinamide-nucleotide amidase|uniref:CinA family protein n=1 Tax=Oceanispirochaeta sp. TaxID=2035350 RepID=UPI002606D259|nr:nicotinamide-nucleotide amidohydrolase family protein [Oceanispirochaeta sp.]MDA3956300.1 nicotinamide-nucleotide amidohydrolase family protein [Oceanispirochaeta sp.]